MPLYFISKVVVIFKLSFFIFISHPDLLLILKSVLIHKIFLLKIEGVPIYQAYGTRFDLSVNLERATLRARNICIDLRALLSKYSLDVP